jgi:hypothetical protein
MALLALLSAAAPSLHAQARKAAEGEAYLSAPELKGDEKSRFTSLGQGTQAVTPKDAEAGGLLEKAAQFYVFRVTWPWYQVKDPEKGDPRTMREIVDEAFHSLPDRKKKLNDEQQRFLEEYSKKLVESIKVVLQNPTPIARVNAARILAHLAETGQENLTAPLVELLEDAKQFDGVKFYALRGLRDLFANGFKKTATAPDERLVRGAQALINFINRKPTYGPGASPLEIEAFHYLGREAIRALGQCRWPALIQNGRVVGQPALVLLRVLVKADQVDPKPSNSEQEEAAIGLCQMQSGLVKSYRPSYAAPFVGSFLVEFGTRYVGEKDPSDRTETWKVQAARLTEALNAWKADNSMDAYIAGLVGKAVPLLRDMESGRTATPGALGTWLEKQEPPKVNRLFEDDPASVVVPGSEEKKPAAQEEKKNTPAEEKKK